jgi:hypothetical protein
LMFWVATLDRLDDKMRTKALNGMNSDQFERALQLTPKFIAPEHYVHGTHLLALVQHLQGVNKNLFEDDALFRVIKAAVETNHPDDLVGLADRIAAMENRKPLVQLENLIKKESDRLPSQIVKAAQQRREQLGGPPLTARL